MIGVRIGEKWGEGRRGVMNGEKLNRKNAQKSDFDGLLCPATEFSLLLEGNGKSRSGFKGEK